MMSGIVISSLFRWIADKHQKNIVKQYPIVNQIKDLYQSAYVKVGKRTSSEGDSLEEQKGMNLSKIVEIMLSHIFRYFYQYDTDSENSGGKSDLHSFDAGKLILLPY